MSTFIRNLLGAGIVSKIGGDLAAVVLHVQEVRGQGTLGCIRIDGCALALLRCLGLGARALGVKTTLKLTSQVGRDSGQVDKGRFAIDHAVGMFNVCFGEVGDVGLKSHQPHEHL